MSIVIHNNQSRDLPLCRKDLQTICNLVLKRHKINSVTLGIEFITNDRMQKINYIYRDKNYPTNILSFPYHISPDERIIIGDIYIAPKVLENESGMINLRNYYCKILVHGLLHLLNYDHNNEKEALRMEKEEQEIYNIICR